MPPDTVTLPARAWAIVAIVVVIGLVIFSLQLASIESQRHRAIDQDRKITLLVSELQPVLRSVQPLLGQVRQLTGPLAATTGRAPDVLAQADPLLRGLNQSNAVGTLANLGSLASDARPLIAGLNASDAPAAIAAVGRLAREITSGASVARLTASAQALLDLIAKTDLVHRAAAAAWLIPLIVDVLNRSLAVQSRSLSLQSRSLATQRATLAIAQQTLDVARQTLEHAASLDRKTGGPLPAPAAGPLAPPGA